MGALTLGAIIIVPAAQVWILSTSQFRDIATFSDYSVLLLSSFELPVGFNLLSLPVTEFATMIILWQAAHRAVFRVVRFLSVAHVHIFSTSDIYHFSNRFTRSHLSFYYC